MALTVTPLTDPTTKGKSRVFGDTRIAFCTITFDNSYPTGGEVVGSAEANKLDMSRIDWITPLPNITSTRIVAYDPATKKLLLFTALSAEAANASDQSAISAPCVVYGK